MASSGRPRPPSRTPRPGSSSYRGGGQRGGRGQPTGSGRPSAAPRPSNAPRPSSAARPGNVPRRGRGPSDPSSMAPDPAAVASKKRKDERRRKSIGDITRRSQVLVVILALFLTSAGIRLVYLQVVASPALAAQALDWRQRNVVIPATRGEILDASGATLAYSVDTYTIVANQRHVGDWKRTDKQGNVIAAGAAGAAKILAPLLGMTAPELGAKLIGKNQYVILAKRISPKVWDQIKAERISGITGEKNSLRVYPAGNIAGNVLGFIDHKGIGQAGVEKFFDGKLKGTPGKETYEISGGLYPRPIPGTEVTHQKEVPGEQVQLTIDRDIQWYTQQALDAQVSSTGAAYGMVVVMNVENGEVLALADSGAVNPNDPGTVKPEARGLRSLSDIFDPGSTAKVITMSAAIENGIAGPTSPFLVPDRYKTPNGQEFQDSHNHEPTRFTLNGILAESSNVGTIMVGQQLSEKQRYDYLTAFGLGKTTGINLPGESAGILRPLSKWDGRTKYGVLFGQGVSATALQAANVFATVANGGVRLQPTVVAGTTDPNGVFIPTPKAAPVQVVSPQTAATVVKMLESVTGEGTGELAKVPGYRVAGKTGTAEIAGPTGKLDSIMASFIGIAPAEKPKIVVATFLRDPKTSIWGGEVAAPLFAKITGYALSKLGVPPSTSAPELYPTNY